MSNNSRMNSEAERPPDDPPPDLTCPKLPPHLLKNPVTLPCCPQATWCRTCAGKTILQNKKICQQCGAAVELGELRRDTDTINRLQAFKEKRAEAEAEAELMAQELPPNQGGDNSDSDSDSDSIHTLGDATEAIGQGLANLTRNLEEDHRDPLIVTPTNFKDTTEFPFKRFIPIYGSLGIHALVSPLEYNMGIPDGRLFSKWTPTEEPWIPYMDNREKRPSFKVWSWLEPEVSPIYMGCETEFRSRDNKYHQRTGDTEKDYLGNGIPHIWYTDQDARGAYIMVNELVPGLSPVLMGKREADGMIWWVTTDKVTRKTHQVWIAGWSQPGSRAFKRLVDFTVQNWPREDLVGPTGGPGKVKIIVARGHAETGTDYDPSLLTTSESSEGEDDEKGLTEDQIRRRRRLLKSRRRAMEARRRGRDGMLITDWLKGRFPEPTPQQTAPIVSASQPLHKSRVWLKDLGTERETLHRTFLPWYPSLKDWLLLGRSPDPTAINNAYEECDFAKWRWKHHNDGEGDIWLAGYEHRAGPRMGKIRKTYRTLKVLTYFVCDPDGRTEEELRETRIRTLQAMASDLGWPILACSSAYRDEDHNEIVYGMGWHEWSETKRRCYRACYRWRCNTARDLDMEPIRPFRSWPEVISFINGFLGGFYETEIQAWELCNGYRPEDDVPRQWWPHTFPQDCRRAKMHMAAIAAQTIADLTRKTGKPGETSDTEWEDFCQAWWCTHREDYIKPTPPKVDHYPGVWEEWSRTPHWGGWDGWSDHEKRRTERIHE